MKTKPRTLFNFLTICAIALLALTQCKTLPTADFSYAPTTNPEAGDSIFFTNMSLDALNYSWDFGDGYSSTEENPYNTYLSSGSYDVTLTAINEDGENAITKTIEIFDPTVFGLTVYYDDQETLVEGAEIYVYDNKYDWDNYNDPQYFTLTDQDGIGLFLNLEAQIYYVDVFKDAGNGVGFWYNGGPTNALDQNKVNAYWMALDYYESSSLKKSAEKFPRERVRPLQVVK